ncbi:hypothetical protein INT47_011370 [Mucor saturninus]|uniref:ZZ-type domain-containing protein n=1 Tax=Mucor saturninus TaxID=64648 RepID=A0A8H7UV59_9FUNG|nr:hypothetical protein INT47_011370 [Mucor saturninus]
MSGKTSTASPQPLDSSTDQPSDPSNDLLNINTNEDYQTVLKSLSVLKHQLKKATEHVDVLNKLKQEALGDPYAFIISLKERKSKSKVPKLQKIITVPDIDWSKYKFLPESRLVQQNNAVNELAQQLLNQSKKSSYRNILDTPMQTEYTSTPPTPVNIANLQQELVKATQTMRQIPSRANSVSDFSDDEEDEPMTTSKTTPRPNGQFYNTTPINTTCAGKGIGKRRTSMIQTGMERDLQASSMDMSEIESPSLSRLQSIEPRTPDDYFSSDTNPMDDPNRAPTFKQPWSDEEQHRLQELLITFPDEPIQAQRFHKISKALGTRTQRQVASRVQKYFIKLAKSGLPVPGRITIPPSCMPKDKEGVSKNKNKGNPNRVTKPNLGPNNRPYATVASTGYVRTSGAHYAEARGPPAVFMSDDEEDNNVNAMMRKVNTANGTSEPSELVIHEGFACDGCGIEPIVGVLYKCTVCDISEEVDLCGSCMEKGSFTNDHHTVDHTFEAVRTANPFPYYADNDYKSPEHLGEYSYLGFQQ